MLGLNKELKNQALSLASDAALSAKAATGKLTYADAIKDSINNAPALAKALQKQGSAGYNEQVKKIINANAELGDSIVELPESASKASTAFSGLSNYFKGLLATLKTMLPLIAAVGAAFAAYSAWKWADNKYNLTYDTNLKNVKEHVSNLQNAQKEVENLNAKADQYKQTLQEIASNYNVTLEGTESVDEMIDKIQSADNVQLTLVDQTEIDKIKLGNDELERTLKLKEQVVTSEQRQAAEDAKDLLNKYKSMDMPDYTILHWNPWKKDDIQDELKEFYKNPGIDINLNENDGAISRTGSLESYLAFYQKYQDLLVKAQEKAGKAKSDKIRKMYESDAKNLQEAIDSMDSELQEKASDITDMLNSFSVNGEGLTALSGYEPYFEKARKMLRLITDKDLTDAQKALNSLIDFFDGSFGKNALKAELKESAGSAEELQKALAGMGLTLDDLGIDNISDLQSYLQETASAAEDAADAINTVEGTEPITGTLQDLAYRMNSENAAKTATNFMEFTSGNGLQIGNKTDGSWSGYRTKISASAFEIINQAGITLAYYGDKLIQLGKNTKDSVIELCGGLGKIQSKQYSGYQACEMSSDYVALRSTHQAVLTSSTSTGNCMVSAAENTFGATATTTDSTGRTTKQGDIDISDGVVEFSSIRNGYDCTVGVYAGGWSGGTYRGSFSPSKGYTEKVLLGDNGAGQLWDRLMAKNATQIMSDRKAKYDIKPLGADTESQIATMSLDSEHFNANPVDIHSELFDRLQPVQYKMVNDDQRIRFGFVAQDVVDAMKELGIREDELDLVHHDQRVTENGYNDTYGMVYTNLIALITHELQLEKQRRSNLELEVADLRSELETMRDNLSGNTN